jgi:hypothetical protein
MVNLFLSHLTSEIDQLLPSSGRFRLRERSKVRTPALNIYVYRVKQFVFTLQGVGCRRQRVHRHALGLFVSEMCPF